MKLLGIVLGVMISASALAQHPTKFAYNLNKRTYSISGMEKGAVKEHAEEWLKQHDTVLVKGGLSNIRFQPDDLMLEECDSAAEKMSYYNEKFNGFPATDDGTFYGADIYVKNKDGVYERCNINLSYFYEVVKVWFPGGSSGRIIYKKPKAK